MSTDISEIQACMSFNIAEVTAGIIYTYYWMCGYFYIVNVTMINDHEVLHPVCGAYK
jgi:hypothetical protein